MKAYRTPKTTLEARRAIAAEQDRLIDQAESLLSEEAKQEIADMRLLAALSKALHEVHRDLLPLKPDFIARVLGHDRRPEVRRSIASMRDWCDRMENAIETVRLEVIDGASRR